MLHVLVYSDSLTWGIIPNTRRRLPFEERWPGLLERKLNDRGQPVRVIEDCLNGRRTVWEDPFKPGRNGRRDARAWLALIAKSAPIWPVTSSMLAASRLRALWTESISTGNSIFCWAKH